MLYHLSEISDLTVLTPRIPRYAVSTHENVKIERVCFSDFIEGCLSALQDLPNKFYVYVPKYEIDKWDIYTPTVYEVIDAKFTHEVWVMKEVEVKCIGIIQSENWDWSKRHNTGIRRRTTFFHHPFKWIEKYD